MKCRLINILLSISAVWLWAGCTDQEILTSYEEVKDATEPIPLSFTPKVSTNVKEEATTRADLNYLNNIYLDTPNTGISNFKDFPWFNETAAIGKSWNDASIIGYKIGEYKNKNGVVLLPHYKFGNFINNSYIVGLYGYHGMNGETQMNWDTMTNETNLSTLSSNFMTNQPLLHTANGNNWNYTPLRYWPNSTANDAKVTFVSYYPFQDFEERGIGIDDNGKITGTGYYRDGRDLNGDGNPDMPDLRCITPPAKGAKGKAAYTFTFKQNPNIEDHVDFLLGINTDKTKQGVNSSGIDLTLKHALCGVMFDLRSNGFTATGTTVTIKVNSVSLEGLYGKGKVYPTSSGVVWEDLEEDDTKYTFAFTPEIVKDIFNNELDELIFDGTKIRYNRRLIYQNIGSQGTGTVKGVELNKKDLLPNARGMRYMMMVIPQAVNDRDAFLVVNYDLTYDYGNGIVNVFKNNEEKIKLKDEKKKDGEGDKSQLFIAGQIIAFNILFNAPKGITMKAVVSNWDDIEEYEVSTEPVDDEDEGGGDQQGGDPEP